MYYIGLDIHKKNTQACVKDEKGNIVSKDRSLSDLRAINSFLDRLGEAEVKVVMEATGFYFWIYDTIVSRGHDAKVVHPVKVKPLMRARSKNDKNDAYMLAELLRSRCLDGIYVPSSDVREMRELTRHRESLVRKKGDLKREVLAHLLQKGMRVPDDLRTNFSQKHISWMRSGDDFILHEKLDVLELLMTKIRNIESKLDELYGEDEDVRLIRTIPGIGRQTAVQLMSMIVDVSRFQDAEKLCGYFGMVPRVRDSGGKEHHGRMTKNGDPMMRSIVERITLSHIRFCDSSITSYFERKSKELGHKKALMSAARKMLAVIHAVLLRGTPFTA